VEQPQPLQPPEQEQQVPQGPMFVLIVVNRDKIRLDEGFGMEVWGLGLNSPVLYLIFG
jgi:hypothetical protein